MEILTPTHWVDYELIDTGFREKLERFGKYVLIRPEPQAVWPKTLPESEWERLSHARYTRMKGKKSSGDDGERGSWTRKPQMPDQWSISYSYKKMNLTFRLGLTAFGHIGVFPEQAINWDYIYDMGAHRVLNLFAYTGGSSVAARAAGADVTHVDSVKPVITWAKEMMIASSLDNISYSPIMGM